MMSKSLCTIAVFAALAHSAAAAPLPQVVEKLLQTSPDILSDVGQRRASDAAVDKAKSGYYPRIDLSVGAGREYTNDLSTRTNFGGGTDYNRQEAQAILTQMLFDGMATKNEVARQRARQLGAAHRLANTSEDIALKTAEAYLDVLRQQELVALTQANLDAHLSTAEQVKLRTSGGFGRKSDDEQIDARVSLAKANLSAAQSSLNEAKIAYMRLVGEVPEDLAKPDTPANLPASMEEAANWAVANNRLLLAAKADVDGANAQHGLAESQMYPRVDLEAGAVYTNSLDGVAVEDSTRYYGMVRMRYTFKSGGDRAYVAETKQLAYSAQEVARRVERQVRQNAALSWNAMSIAAERVPVLTQYANSSKSARDEYSKQFSLGQRSLLDLLDSENEYFTARRDLVAGQYDELRAKFRLLADGNQLLSTLNVKPLAETELAQQ
ncbi:TolC family outer membrane protein [Chitinibacter fontanus]|uniref:TolC family outer membrane protein n=1 Tax=Chitinibacter fontanus TaxID=1737446 RepID=A0A7D5ZFP3_9NEIS|nr:TolC family outer membrane protein [Chitinibacter fontanus]QLI81009.1 TolC family outer membrane protein [Chitinibacter fontanus]